MTCLNLKLFDQAQRELSVVLKKRYPSKTLPFKFATLQKRYPSKTLPSKKRYPKIRYPKKFATFKISKEMYFKNSLPCE